MSKRNWKEYNGQLVRRGEFYISLDFMDNRENEVKRMNEKKRGRPYQFPHSLMQFLAFVHIAFLPYRQMEGFLRKLSEYIPKLKAADYSTICKRMKKMDIKLPEEKLGNDMIVALDSTGMKISNRGDWMREKWKVRRGWIKVHVAVDVNTKRLIALEITDERTGDGKMLKPLIEKAEKNVGKGKIKQATADGAYDSKQNFEYLDGKGIEPAVKTRKNSSTKARGSPSRAKHVREMKELGYEGWKSKYRYGERWMAETFFSGVKRTFGETTRAKSVEGMFQEVEMKFSFYNALIGL
jgi:hypothetical protein